MVNEFGIFIIFGFTVGVVLIFILITCSFGKKEPPPPGNPEADKTTKTTPEAKKTADVIVTISEPVKKATVEKAAATPTTPQAPAKKSPFRLSGGGERGKTSSYRTAEVFQFEPKNLSARGGISQKSMTAEDSKIESKKTESKPTLK